MPNDLQDTSDAPQITDAAQEPDAGAKPLSPTRKKAMQGRDVEYPSPDQRPKSATTELGDASRAETGAEKPEVKWHHEVAEPDKEGRPAGTPEGWRPGGPERG